MIIGLPYIFKGVLYDCAAVLAGGRVLGIVPKSNLPGYQEFYEQRWFQSWKNRQNDQLSIAGQIVPFGNQLLFQIGRGVVGIELCEDVWVANQPSIALAAAGATIIANPSASPEQVGKAAYRRQLLQVQSQRLAAAYLYAGADASESTTDIVMGGQQIIAEAGQILSEREPLAGAQRLTVTDIDLDHLAMLRRRDTNTSNQVTMPLIDCGITARQGDLVRTIDPLPFAPKTPLDSDLALDIQAQGLATRFQHSGLQKLLVGLSGGLDSTLALLVAIRAMERLGKKPSVHIQTITMPGLASSPQTQHQATKLAQVLGIPNMNIPITELAKTALHMLGHNQTQDIVYENVQARARTNLLFSYANQIQGLVVGTGDLSEIALGWCTFNGDHMSHYNVNAGVPKTLVKHLVTHIAKQSPPKIRAILQAIVDTPISPELTKKGSGISQQTEAVIGPFVLHDFFLYQLVHWGDAPAKIAYLAKQVFSSQYSDAAIDTWLQLFLRRFVQNQWKRSVAPDGPKVSSVSLSPRGDWRMPSDMSVAALERVTLAT